MKVGDYVRTKKGIKQIYAINENATKWKYLFKLKEQDGDGCIDLGYLCNDDIIGEPKERPIDLIQVGDYVNGFEVLRIDKECDLYPTTLKCQYPNHIYYFDIFNEDIKSIVTKEQFESIKYEVE